MGQPTVAPGRCAWTGERSDRLVTVTVDAVDRIGRRRGPVELRVRPGHEAALRAHVARVHRFGAPFLVAVILIGALAFGAAMAPIVDASWAAVAIPLSGLLVAVLGLLFVAFPFTTPETSAFFGLRRSIVIARILGLLLAALGAWIVLAG
jgi:small neutral amino acid transporter SnatA (MarC family)